MDRRIRGFEASREDAAPVVQRAPGRGTLTEDIERRPADTIQRKSASSQAPAAAAQVAERGFCDLGSSLPHLDTIQESFGRHDVSGVQAHVGGKAAEASDGLDASAYAMGGQVAFREQPDLHTAAHEAAHVVQQRGGVSLKGNVSEAGDPYEQHADKVADAVVRGESAERILDTHAGDSSSSGVIQRRPSKGKKDVTADRIPGQVSDGLDADVRDGRDPVLKTGPALTDFGRVNTGRRSVKAVAVRNDDTRRIMLESVEPAAADPFHDFELAAGRTETLEPGDQINLDIAFTPSRNGVVQQNFKLTTNAGEVSPAENIHVKGEGIDETKTIQIDGHAASEQRNTEDRIAEQDDERAKTEGDRTNDPLHKKRTAVLKSVEDWKGAAQHLNLKVADWTQQNWTDFLAQTGGDYELYQPDLFTQYGKTVMTKIIGKALEVENPVLGFIVDKAFDKYLDFMFDMVSHHKTVTADEQSADAVATSGKAIGKKNEEVAAYRDAADLVIKDAASTSELRITQASTETDLNGWQTWANEQAASLKTAGVKGGDRSLSNKLLEQWVLERSAGPDKASKDTNPDAWKKAKAKLKDSGQLKTLKRNDLFIHECRHEWGLLALAEGPDFADQLEAKRVDLEQQMKSGGNTDGKATASLIKNTLSGPDRTGFNFKRSTNVEQTAKGFESQDYQALDRFRRAGRDFFMIFDMDLETDGEAVYVTRFYYDLDGSRWSRAPR